MPLRRTPPNTPSTEDLTLINTAATRSRALTTPLAGSTPNLSSTENENIAGGLKRKRDDCTCCMDEIRSMIAAANARTDKKLSAVQATLSDILTQNLDIKESISFISHQYEDMKIKVEQLEKERKADHGYISQLEEKLENMERLMCSSKIEIRNVPRKPGENKDDLCAIVMEAGTTLNVKIQRTDLKDVYRAGKKDVPSAIVVDFLSVTTKENIINGAKQFNKTYKQNRLNTGHLKLGGPIKPVYVSEKLTHKTQRIYFLSRNFAKDNNYKYCWTSYGKVFLRKADGSPQILVKQESDLIELQGK
ncbi:hypothetical protein ABMA27_016208 [Loxostege sticticalis]|uniref:FP protein C-terminal domain-containing protein n=1 Tax=Loxostege sticticalis TaxID=481309 RepID=A0ABR3I5X4_LOXSC